MNNDKFIRAAQAHSTFKSEASVVLEGGVLSVRAGKVTGRALPWGLSVTTPAIARKCREQGVSEWLHVFEYSTRKTAQAAAALVCDYMREVRPPCPTTWGCLQGHVHTLFTDSEGEVSSCEHQFKEAFALLEEEARRVEADDIRHDWQQGRPGPSFNKGGEVATHMRWRSYEPADFIRRLVEGPEWLNHLGNRRWVATSLWRDALYAHNNVCAVVLPECALPEDLASQVLPLSEEDAVKVSAMCAASRPGMVIKSQDLMRPLLLAERVRKHFGTEPMLVLEGTKDGAWGKAGLLSETHERELGSFSSTWRLENQTNDPVWLPGYSLGTFYPGQVAAALKLWKPTELVHVGVEANFVSDGTVTSVNMALTSVPGTLDRRVLLTGARR